MKQKNNRYIPAIKDGKFECKVHESQESFCGFVYRTSCMLIKSFFRYLDPRTREKIDWVAPQIPIARSELPVITWIGHSTFLIQIGGINILTDPIFGNVTMLYPRIIKPGIALNDLPPIDFVLISHNHMDHMESSSVKKLARHAHVKFCVPYGDKSWFDTRSIGTAHEFTWWQSREINGVRFTFLPAVHWTQRTLRDRNKSLWGSWMIEYKDTCIYFAGDTAYGNHFQSIASEFSRIDIALMPIGPCEPRDWMAHSHMDSKEACQAFSVLQAQHFIPMHWGTYHFGNELARLPITRLEEYWISSGLSCQAMLHLPKAGKPIYISNFFGLHTKKQAQDRV